MSKQISIKDLLYGITINKVSYSVICKLNNITSLIGSPKYVGGGFYCSNNRLNSLAGSPKEVGKVFSCYGNPKLHKAYPDGIDKWIAENVKVGGSILA